MKANSRPLMLLAGCAVIALALVALIATAPKNPVALIRVVDASGTPLAGAIVRPEGLQAACQILR
jgi:hypothetical protein